MLRSVLVSLVMCACVCTVAAAGTPSAATSTVPCGIILVGTTAGVADPCGEFSITVRDALGNPCAGVPVDIDFSACVPDIRVGSPPAQTWPGVGVNCLIHVVTLSTNSAGVATFRIVGAAQTAGCGPGAGFKCALVRAASIPLGSVNVAALDLNAAGGVTPADLAIWISDFFCGQYFGRSDYNCSATLTAGDLSKWIQCFFLAGSAASGTAFCIPPP